MLQKYTPTQPVEPAPAEVAAATFGDTQAKVCVNCSGRSTFRIATQRKTYHMAPQTDGTAKRIDVADPVEFEFDGSLSRLDQIATAHGLDDECKLSIILAMAASWRKLGDLVAADIAEKR